MLSGISRLLGLGSSAQDRCLVAPAANEGWWGGRSRTLANEDAAAPENRGKDQSLRPLDCDANATIPSKTHAG
jgi:hypothetical protein